VNEIVIFCALSLTLSSAPSRPGNPFPSKSYKPVMVAASLLTLPTELLTDIARYAYLERDSESLTYSVDLLLISRTLHDAFLPAVYHEINEIDLGTNASQKLHQTLERRPDIAGLIRVYFREYVDRSTASKVLALPNCLDLTIWVSPNGDEEPSMLDVFKWISSCGRLITLSISNMSCDWHLDSMKLALQSRTFDSIGLTTPNTLRRLNLRNVDI
jgi:hypothetical protein